MIKILTAAGINPRRRGHNPTNYILRLHPLNTLAMPDLETLFHSSRLRGKCASLIVVDLTASLASGASWDVDADGMYCSNHTQKKWDTLLIFGQGKQHPGLRDPPPPPPPTGPTPTLTLPLMMSLTHRLTTAYGITHKPLSPLKFHLKKKPPWKM